MQSLHLWKKIQEKIWEKNLEIKNGKNLGGKSWKKWGGFWKNSGGGILGENSGKNSEKESWRKISGKKFWKKILGKNLEKKFWKKFPLVYITSLSSIKKIISLVYWWPSYFWFLSNGIESIIHLLSTDEWQFLIHSAFSSCSCISVSFNCFDLYPNIISFLFYFLRLIFVFLQDSSYFLEPKLNCTN